MRQLQRRRRVLLPHGERHVRRQRRLHRDGQWLLHVRTQGEPLAMLVHHLRRLIAFAALLACGSDGTYLTSTSARRSALEASLVNKENDYSKLRLAHYATGNA